MLRIVSTLLICVALASAFGFSARAEDYRDSENGFSLSVPDGWRVAKAPMQGVALVVASPRVAETRGNCNVISQAVAETREASQDELNAQFDKVVNEAFWRQIIGGAHMTNVVIDKTGSDMRSGRKSFFVVTHFDAAVEGGQTMRFAGKQALHMIPGRIYFVTCLANEAGYAQDEKDFETVLTSFEPSNAVVIAGLPTRNVTLGFQPRALSAGALSQLSAGGARGLASGRR